MKKTYLSSVMTAVMLLVASMVSAQTETGWRIGLKAGWTYNSLSINTQYAYDFRYKGMGGGDLGVWGQYMFLPWVGVRADLEWIDKNYSMKRILKEAVNAGDDHVNGYFSLPITATFRFGAGRVHGYTNLGGFLGCWTMNYVEGVDFTLSQPLGDIPNPYSYAMDREFDSRRDNRFEAGLVGGLGVEYEFCPKWFLAVEARYYYAMTSRTKNYMRHFFNPSYNNTFSLSLAVSHTLPW